MGTFRDDLEGLRDWLAAEQITEIAMEATGSYWKPIWYGLEDLENVELLLVNARHVKQVPGRKTDVKDAVWLCLNRPGFGGQFADVIIAETGGDRDRFPDAAHMASWAGVCPGNNEFAGTDPQGRRVAVYRDLLTGAATNEVSGEDSKVG